MRFRYLLAGFLVGVLGCHSGSVTKTEILRIVTLEAPESLDPHLRNSLGSQNAVYQMYEPLVFRNKNLNLTPGLAESWENPKDNVWQFRIRKNVKFHTGKMLDAYDVE